MANILYLGCDVHGSTSLHRAQALARLGHTISHHNPAAAATGVMGSPWLDPIHYRTGYRILQSPIRSWLSKIIDSIPKPDLVWVDSGEFFGPTAIACLKGLACPILLYNVDDPTGPRDGRRFDSLLKALPLYDLVVVVRKETEAECLSLGAKQVMRVIRSYDEVAHQPFLNPTDIPTKFRSEVIFIGTWMRYEKRDEFLLQLLEQGIPLSIWGSRWQKSPYWAKLQIAYRGGSLSGRDYVAAIQGSKICLGLLSKGNRDLHTQRSLEVPFAAGLLCAERTAEHLEMYQEGKEAVFWSDAKECASICQRLLLNDSLRENIRVAGQKRVLALQVGNESICRKILTHWHIG
ncbi:CgeB family protein [Hymenobacter radiodurans]|uniref:CgeB family protein n=1 Tax=Hymenobacter radiodurans TaxID=2496028 RepID=UPI0010588BFC|nr:glycosyltransferase [Hymenobacter radiodurans]